MVGVDSKESHNYKFLLHTKNRYLPKYKAPANKHPLLLQTLSPPRSASEPLKSCQDSTRPYASPFGVVEDRSVLMAGFWWFQWTQRDMWNICC